MDFDLSQDQQMLVDTAAAFARRESPPGRLRKLRADPIGWSRDLWRRMGELGWLAIPFPEDAGGLAGSFADVALVVAELGATLVPEPYVPSVVLGGHAILFAGSAEQRARWIAPLAAGETSLALAYAEPQGRFEPSAVGLRAERTGGGWRLRGKKTFVLNGHAADAIVVSARTSGGDRDRDGVSLFVVDRSTRGLGVQPVPTIDGQRAAVLSFDGVDVAADRLLGAEGGAVPVLSRVLDHAAAAACAEATGILRAVLRMTVEYLGTREQFGVKIGSFQALQHRTVDMFVETELARCMSVLASLRVSSADEAERQGAVSAAKVQIAQSGRYVTQQALQLHGGIGITDEHDVGLYFKRMHALSTLFGDEEWHLARYASLPAFTAGIG